MDRQPCKYLPAGYWWSSSGKRATLYLRYGWAATVEPPEVRVRADPPLWPEIHGDCRSLAQGMLHSERLIAVQICWGSPERSDFRWQLRRARRRRLAPLDTQAQPQSTPLEGACKPPSSAL